MPRGGRKDFIVDEPRMIDIRGSTILIYVNKLQNQQNKILHFGKHDLCSKDVDQTNHDKGSESNAIGCSKTHKVDMDNSPKPFAPNLGRI